MFLAPTLPHDPSRISTYCEALLAAFDAVSFTRFYADSLGRILENEVDTQGPFRDVLFRLLLRSQHDGTLRELLVTALCYRAGNAELVDALSDVLALQPIVKLATLLSEGQYPPELGHDTVDALYTARRMRKRAWQHQDGRTAWIEILVVCDKLAAGDDPIPPLLACLSAIDHQWRPSRGANVLHDQIATIRLRYGISHASGTGRWRAADSPDAIPRAQLAWDTMSGARPGRSTRRLVAAITDGWRAATSDGQAAYQLAMITFGLTAFLFHDSLQPQKLEQEYLKGNLALKQEPRRAEQYPVLDSLLVPTTVSSEARQVLCDKQLVDELDDAYRAFRDDYAKETPYRFTLQKSDAGTQGLGTSWTDNDDDTTLLIPSTIAYASERNPSPRTQPCQACAVAPPSRKAKPPPRDTAPPDPCSKEGAANQLHCALREPIERSLAIFKLTDHLHKHPGKLVRFYFISPEGVQRTIPAHSPRLFPAYRTFHGESYVNRALSHDPGVFAGDSGEKGGCAIGAGDHHRTGSGPYFDPLGSGVVETACYPVDVAAAKEPARVVGVLCADVAVPLEAEMARLEEASQALDLTLVRVSLRADGDVDPLSCRDFAHQRCSSKLARIDQDQSKGKAREYFRRFIAPKRDPLAMGGVVPIEVDKNNINNSYFGVVVSAETPDNGPWYIAISKIRASKARNYTSLTLCALTLLAGVSVLVLSFRRKLKRQQALLARGLHYGLLEIEDGRIIGANDRAEEILLTNLPRLGIHASARLTRKTLSGMLEDRCVLISENQQLREDDIRTYDSTIRDRTSDGLTSIFYAWVKLRKSWIKITSTVIMMPSGNEHVFCALDTNIDEAHRLFLANLGPGDD